jgi:hypothetical protein
LIGACWWLVSSFWIVPQPLDPIQVRDAIDAFCRERSALGYPLPQTITLSQLVKDGYLHAEAIRGVGSAEVTFSLRPDTRNPGSVLIEARLPDGSRIGALANGSIQPLAPPSTNR